MWIPLDDLQHITRHKAVLVTTQADLDKYSPTISNVVQIVLLESPENIELSFLKIMQTAKEVDIYKTMTIAVDPGSVSIGIALILEKHVITSEVVSTRAAVVEKIKLYCRTFTPVQTFLKIGYGYPRLAHHILRYLFSPDFNRNGIEISIVDEALSSKHLYTEGPDDLNRHQNAAIAIGHRKGTIITEQNLGDFVNTPVSAKSIKKIQKRARLKHRRVTISKQDALEIHSGKKTISDFLKDDLAEKK
jgi:hypothetical protein